MASDAGSAATRGPRPWRRYPLWRSLCLNGVTLGSNALGCAAILVAYHGYPVLGWPLALSYLVFAVAQGYLFMPLVVCPGCVYRTLAGGRCPSGLNRLSARLCPPQPVPGGFAKRSSGVFSSGKLRLYSLVVPLSLALAGIVVRFSWLGVALTVTVASLALLQLTLLRAMACSHCLARRWCTAARVRHPA